MRVLSGFAAALFGVSSSVALAGDGNTISLLQVSNGTVGNTLYIDQSAATGSTVAGSRNGLQPATQIGSANTASVTVEGTGGTVALNQNNALLGLGLGNQAEGVISGLLGFGSIQQTGDGNVASLNVASPDALDPATGRIVQTGFLNTGTLTVNGSGAEGTLVQLGSRNSNALTVEGTGTTASFTQVGNNASNPQGVTVVSNGGSVAITQFSF